MTPHAFKKNRISSRIRIYIRKGLIPLIRGPRMNVLMKKPRVENLVTLSLKKNCKGYIILVSFAPQKL
jgi:hypothetical protein